MDFKITGHTHQKGGAAGREVWGGRAAGVGEGRGARLRGVVVRRTGPNQ